MRARLTLASVFITTVLVIVAWPIDTAECGGIVEDGLISYWTFDDMDGDTVNDVWGENNGTLVNNPEIVDEGKFGNALDPAPGYVEFDDSDMPAGNDPRTISAWVNLEMIPNSFGTVAEWGAMMDAGRFGIMIGTGAKILSVGEMADMLSDSALEVDEWSHVTITYDSDLLRIYINGELDKEGRPGLQWGNAARDLNTVLAFGRIGADPALGELFAFGIVDEVSIYNKTLSADEVEQNFKAQGLAVNSAGKAALTWGAIKASN